MDIWKINKILESQITAEKLYEYYIVQKLSAPEIAKIYKCSNRSIYRRLKNFKISTRSMTEARKLMNIKGENNANWRGGRFEEGHGYILVYCPDHPHSIHGKYMWEHRLIIEQSIGRYLTKNEIVHHINGIKDDNRLINLCLTTPQKHNTHTVVEILQKRIRDLEQELDKVMNG